MDRGNSDFFAVDAILFSIWPFLAMRLMKYFFHVALFSLILSLDVSFPYVTTTSPFLLRSLPNSLTPRPSHLQHSPCIYRVLYDLVCLWLDGGFKRNFLGEIYNFNFAIILRFFSHRNIHFLNPYWKCNFTKTSPVRLLVGRSVG